MWWWTFLKNVQKTKISLFQKKMDELLIVGLDFHYQNYYSFFYVVKTSSNIKMMPILWAVGDKPLINIIFIIIATKCYDNDFKNCRKQLKYLHFRKNRRVSFYRNRLKVTKVIYFMQICWQDFYQCYHVVHDIKCI